MIAGFLHAVGTGEIDIVKAALAAHPELVNQNGPHPFWGGQPQALHLAIESKRLELIDLLLAHGADPNGTNDQYDLWSPVMLAIDRKLPQVVEQLKAHGARIGLLEALLLSDDATVAALLADGLPDIKPNLGSLLNFARTRFALDRMLELGAPTDVKDRWGSTPIDSFSRMGAAGEPLLRRMAELGHTIRPEYLARLGDQVALAKLDRAVLDEPAVMMGAVDFRRHELVRWLLAQGVSPNARAVAQSRQTALHSAAWNGDLEMVKILVEAGADPNALDEEYKGTPLGFAEASREMTNNPAVDDVIAYLRALT